MTAESLPALPPPIVVSGQESLDSLLSKEWLIANRLGAYASSTAAGCNARRYHALLVAATAPPVGRMVMLSTVMEQLTCGQTTYHLATNEFSGAFSPLGAVHLVEYRDEVAPTFIYRAGPLTLTKEILLADAANAVAVRYTLRGGQASLSLWPFTPLRDFHHLRKVHEPHQMMFELTEGGLVVQDRIRNSPALHLTSKEAKFEGRPQWWYQFHYRIDASRGQDSFEDLYTPGFFRIELADGQSCQINASLAEPVPVGFATTLELRRRRLEELAASVGADADETTRRLAAATDAFVVQRSFPNAPSSATIVAGYPWFADWGRDAFIALPGLLLCTGRFDLARQVFRTFTLHLEGGMIPNRFDDYSFSAHYNSIDASLWFILAADAYVRASGDTAFWDDLLGPTAHTILQAYQNGTLFDIHADADGLLMGGSPKTQLTWMDAALGDEVVTPRHGKAVEINALWYAAHRILAERTRGHDAGAANALDHQADLIQAAFRSAFWNPAFRCLYDCISETGPDDAFRPNQIYAVALPYSPLSDEQQAAVVRAVAQRLLTPCGLRTLAPEDRRYKRRYGGSCENRDRAYHQGTVWSHLMGAFIEAYLKVETGPETVENAGQMLVAFAGHLHEAGLGQVSEIFDGDPPHHPAGCFAQAWSVAEVLRAKLLVRQAQRNVKT